MDKYEITLECPTFTSFKLVELLRYLKHLGDVGSTQAVSIGDKKFSFNGDCSDRIYKISVNGISLTDIDVMGVKGKSEAPESHREGER